MLSKSRGQVLRLAAIFHVLFTIGEEDPFEPGDGEPGADVISSIAVKAAIDFVRVSCKQVAFISGRGCLEDELERYGNGGSQMFFSAPVLFCTQVHAFLFTFRRCCTRWHI